MTIRPQTEHEWTIHSINIQGMFFERWCRRVVSESVSWTLVSTNYPVDFPPNEYGARESALDIRAQRNFVHNRLTLLVECKKANPEFVNWIFFAKEPGTDGGTFVARAISNRPADQVTPIWQAATGLARLGSPLVVADDARETRGRYADYKDGQKTKTANTAISEAAFQVALATQFVASEEEQINDRLRGMADRPKHPSTMPYQRQLFLPTVVTSARLFACAFDPGDVDPATGEIPYDKAELTELASLVYEYPLPRSLQAGPDVFSHAFESGSMEHHVRMHVLIVHSEAFAQALADNFSLQGLDSAAPLIGT